MNLRKIFISAISILSLSNAFKSIHISHNFWGKNMKLSVPETIDKSNCNLYVFHGGLFGKIPTEAYSSMLQPIINHGHIVVHGNDLSLTKDDIKLIERKLRCKFNSTISIGHSTGYQIAKKSFADSHIGLDPIAFDNDILPSMIPRFQPPETVESFTKLSKYFFDTSKLPFGFVFRNFMNEEDSVEKCEPDMIIKAENTYTTNNIPVPFHMGLALEANCTSFIANGVGHSDILNEEWIFIVREVFDVPESKSLELYRNWVGNVIVGKEKTDFILE